MELFTTQSRSIKSIEDRRIILQAVKALSENGHHRMAQTLWDDAINPYSSTPQKRVSLPGETA